MYGYLYEGGGCSILPESIIEVPPSLRPDWYRDHPAGWSLYWFGYLNYSGTQEYASGETTRHALCLDEAGLVVVDFGVDPRESSGSWAGWLVAWGPPGMETSGFMFTPEREPEWIPPLGPPAPPEEPRVPERRRPLWPAMVGIGSLLGVAVGIAYSAGSR